MEQQEEGKRVVMLTPQQLIDHSQETLDIMLDMYHIARDHNDRYMVTYARAGIIYWVDAIRFWENVLKQEQKNGQS